MKEVLLVVGLMVACFFLGYIGGKNSEQKAELQKDVQLYQKRENNTAEQEKKAQQIKIVYRELKSDEKDCDYVLDFDVSKCLPK